jgi:hypothetical protein
MDRSRSKAIYDEAFSVPGLLAEIAKGDATGISENNLLKYGLAGRCGKVRA